MIDNLPICYFPASPANNYILDQLATYFIISNFMKQALIVLAFICFTSSSFIFSEDNRILQAVSIPASQAQYRALIKQQNLKSISATNSKKLSYQLGDNSFSSMTTQEFSSLMTNQITLPSPINRVQSPTSNIFKATTIPSNITIDWRLQNKVSSVKSQGTCNSCYASTAASDYQSSYAIKYSKLISVSTQVLVDCSSSFGNKGCVGGFYRNSFNYWLSVKGVMPEYAYPYMGVVQACKKVTPMFGFYPISSYYANDNFSCSTITQKLVTRPVIVCVDAANSEWQFYKSGILSTCGTQTPSKLNHGVQVIGIYQYTNGTNYYIIKNSWGTSWGESGYMRIDRNIQGGNLCNICAYPYHSII